MFVSIGGSLKWEPHLYSPCPRVRHPLGGSRVFPPSRGNDTPCFVANGLVRKNSRKLELIFFQDTPQLFSFLKSNFSISLDIYIQKGYFLVKVSVTKANKQKQNKHTKMKKIIRLTESDLQGIIENSAKRIVKEHINTDREIALAQKELHKMGNSLSSIGLRLEGTKFRKLYLDMRNSMVALNNALIKEIRGE